jgi:hypothetical protein
MIGPAGSRAWRRPSLGRLARHGGDEVMTFDGRSVSSYGPGAGLAAQAADQVYRREPAAGSVIASWSSVTL